MTGPSLTRRDELLTDGALGWLTDGDVAAFEAVRRDTGAAVEFAALERTAAVVALATPEAVAPLVDAQRSMQLASRLLLDAQAFFAAKNPTVAPTQHRIGLPTWWLAAAAVAVCSWLLFADDTAPAADRAAALRAARGVVQCAWQPGPSERRGEVTGDVVWDAARQQGWLRLAGLPALDASQRYQLWIVDETRQGPPVDGGLLVLPTDRGEAIVSMAPRLPIGRAAAFVLTVERAEGVVVSSQEHVVAIARP